MVVVVVVKYSGTCLRQPILGLTDLYSIERWLLCRGTVDCNALVLFGARGG